MTKETTIMFLQALLEQITYDQVLVEGLETTQNDDAGHVTLHWLKLPRPAPVEPTQPKTERWLQ